MVRPPQPPEPKAPMPDPGKVEDAAFLHEQFGIAERRAVDMVVPPGEAEDAEAIVEAVRERDRHKDPLADVPTPKEPQHEQVADTDEVRLKPVLHNPNNRTGGG